MQAPRRRWNDGLWIRGNLTFPENLQGKSTSESMGNRTHQNWPPWHSEVSAKYRTSGREVIRKSEWLSILWFEVPVAYFQLLGMVWSKTFLWEWNKYLHIMQTGGHQGKSRNFIHTWSRQAFWWCFKHQNQLKIYGQPEGLWEWALQKEEMMLMVMMVTECLLWDPHGAKQCPQLSHLIFITIQRGRY